MDIIEDEIVKLGDEVKVIGNKLTLFIQQYEAKLTAMNLGIRTWMKLGDSESFFGYDKVNGKWGIYFKLENDSTPVPAAHASLNQRFGVAKRLKELEVNHIKNAQSFVKRASVFLGGESCELTIEQDNPVDFNDLGKN